MSGKYLKLDVGWSVSEWLYEAEPGVRLAWICLLCHAREAGIDGTVKNVKPHIAARRWNIPEHDVDEMYHRARKDGAIEIEGDTVRIVNWSVYQGTSTARVRKWREQKAEHSANVPDAKKEPKPKKARQSRKSKEDPEASQNSVQQAEPDPDSQSQQSEPQKPNPWVQAAKTLNRVCEILGAKPPSEATVTRHSAASHPLQQLLQTYEPEACARMYVQAIKADGTPLGWNWVLNNASALEAKLNGKAVKAVKAVTVAEKAMMAMEDL